MRGNISEKKVAWIVGGSVLVVLCLIQGIIQLYFFCFPVEFALNKRITESVSANGIVRVADLTDFEWDEMWICADYSYSSSFEETTGMQPPNERGAPDDYIFFTNSKEFMRNGGNNVRLDGFPNETFAKDREGKSIGRVWRFTPETAVFKVKMRDDGYISLLPLGEMWKVPEGWDTSA
ncbi:MAG: hypothetical protein RSG57_04440 [Christensenellaceae bacterium]